MSLPWRRRAIERAAAGLLPAAQERRLRDHLARCSRCRVYYDQLTSTARALAGAPAQATREQIARQRERLALAIGAPPGPAPRAVPGSRRWLLALTPALAAAVLVVAMRARRPDQPATLQPAGSDIRWRGAGDGTAGVGQASLLVYASPKGPDAQRQVRMVAEFPGSHEGVVSRQDYVQFTARHDFPRVFVTLLGLDARGTIHRYFPRPGTPARPHPPGASAGPLGPSLDLGSSHPPGPLRLLALFNDQPLDEAQIRRAIAEAPPPAARGWSLALPGHQVTGLLLVRP